MTDHSITIHNMHVWSFLWSKFSTATLFYLLLTGWKEIIPLVDISDMTLPSSPAAYLQLHPCESDTTEAAKPSTKAQVCVRIK